MKKLFKEPLLHFLIIGFLMFTAYDFLNEDLAENEREILVTQSQMDLMFFQWATRNGRPASQPEKNGLIDNFIRQEILYREAIALGLDQNDPIIRRRLAQKMEYLFDDLAPVPEPTDLDLRSYIEANQRRFIKPGTVSFMHVYFSTDNGPDAANTRSVALLSRLRSGDALPEDSGDRLLLPTSYTQVTEREVRSALGEVFAAEIFILPQDQWAGPIASGYGIHLVKLTSITQDSIPPFDVIREDAIKEWRYEKEKSLQNAFVEGLRAKYQVKINGELVDPGTAGT